MTQSLPPVTVALARTAIQADIQDHLKKSFSALPAALAARVEEAFGAILIDSQLDELTYGERCARDLLRGYSEVALRWNEASADQRNNTAIAADESAELKARLLLQLERKRCEGRYNLDEAAELMAQNGDVSEEQILTKLAKAAQSGALLTYMPGSKASNEYKTGTGRFKTVDTYYDECYWDDLNRWLSEHEPRIPFRFPDPSVPQHSEIKPTSLLPALGLKKREQQIGAIEVAIARLGLIAMAIPTGKKSDIFAECRRVDLVLLFGGGPDPFKEAWQEAVRQKRVRMADHKKFGGK